MRNWRRSLSFLHQNDMQVGELSQRSANVTSGSRLRDGLLGDFVFSIAGIR